MYKLSQFTETDQATVIRFIKEYPFAIIIAQGETCPVATHVPLFVDVDDTGKIILSGHMMRKTDHHLAFEKNSRVLVIFNGPHTYISASWYGNPKTASTWNYMAVHAKGTIHFLDEAASYKAVKDITEKYEGHHTAAAFHQLGDDYVYSMIKAIVAFTIEVEVLENVFKLSQNRDEQSKQNIIAELEKKGDENSKLIAQEMKKRL
ncbi:MAG TPA: FMN-binding negative transcriptional regulator [Ferruginibacter sp.]|nr:FMN-binding negative transcriptional regulator [Ferruginibacter sp.]HMP21609.1 FMN-binding negative transcriptional regulator [Ferruginibacter sp.]